ncbi:MAG: SAM-dependent methyltransferase [Actinomycetota bacterium]
MSERVAERIRVAIRERGPITFDEYLREALYGQGGFYEGTPIGARGHFVTAPHVHPIFSRLVGSAVEGLWECLERPLPLRLFEVGAGDGTMGRELVDGFGRAGIELEYTAVETSPGARAALAGVTPRVVERLADAGRADAVIVVANELLDNLPFRRVRGRGGRVVEIRVGLDGERLVEIEAPCEPGLEPPSLADGEEATVPTGALAFIEELAAWMTTGYALLIDYGSETGPAGEVHAYRDHRVLEDVLDDPGSADVTAGVDLGALAGRAISHRLQAFAPVSQSSALVALGLEDWLRAELTRQGDEVSAVQGAEAVRTWEGRNRARLLADPAGLGGLRWLVLATSGLPEPGWLVRARDPRSGPLR